MEITLFIPELIWPEPGDREALDALACPALETLLTRSRHHRRPPLSLEATLADAFGLPHGAPYAALRLLGETGAPLPEGGGWLCADPVHLRFQQERLILADSGSFALEEDEATLIVGELNRYFPDIGVFHIATSQRWYLELAAKTGATLGEFGEFDVPPLSAIAGRRVERQLPETKQAGWLRRFLNEAQMLLHSHPANAARESTGRLPINSLWLWGAGSLPQAMEKRFDSVWSNNPLALGLGRAAGIPTHAVPADAQALLDASPADSHPLLVLEELLGPVQYEDGEAYRAALRSLETCYFAPLQKALASGCISRLNIEASTAYGALRWEATRSDQWKFWQRPQTLAALATALAKDPA